MELTESIVAENATGSALTPYRYDGKSLAALRGSMSAERLGTYLKLALGDHRTAMSMYT